MTQDPSAVWPVTQELSETFHRILENFSRIIAFTSSCIFLDESGFLRVIAQRNHPNRDDLIGMSFSYQGNTLMEEIIRSQVPVMLTDAQADPRFERWADSEHVRGWMGLPLIVNERVIGLITVDSDKVGAYGEKDVQLAQAFADQAAIAVEKAQLAHALADEKRNLELLSHLSHTISHSLDLYDVAETALKLVSSIFQDGFGAVALFEQASNDFSVLAVSHQSRGSLRRQGLRVALERAGPMRRALLEDQLIFVPQDRPFTVPDWLAADPDRIKSGAAIPLHAGQEIIGVLILLSSHEDGIQPRHAATLRSLASPIALALQNAKLYAEERKRRTEAETLRTAISALTLDLGMEEILHTILHRLRRVVAFDSSSVMLWERDHLRVVACFGFSDSEKIVGQEFAADNPLFQQLQTERSPLFIEDAQQDPRFFGWGGTSYVHGWMGVPLLHRGQLIGYITLDSRERAAYGEPEAALAQAFASQATVTIVNARLLQASTRNATEQLEVSRIVHLLGAATSPTDLLRAAAPGLHRLLLCDAVELALYRLDAEQVTGYEIDFPEQTERPEHLPQVVRKEYDLKSSSAALESCRGNVLVTADLSLETHPIERQQVENGFYSRTCMPLRKADTVIGHLALFWRVQDGFPSQNLSRLGQIADALTMALVKLELLEETKQRANELAVLAQLSADLRILEKTADIMETALDFVLRVFGGDRGRIYVPSKDTDSLRIALQMGGFTFLQEEEFPLFGSVVGEVFRTGRPQLARNIISEPGAFQQAVQGWKDAGYEQATALLGPLLTKDGINGVISVVSPTRSEPYTNADLNLFAAMAELIGSALYRASILETLEQRVQSRTQELASANERLQELDELKNQFVANVSHELRTPLTNIKLYLDLINRGRQDRQEHYMQVLAEETNRLEELVESILDLSRLQAAPTAQLFRPERLDLRNLAEDVVQNQLTRAATQGIQLSLTPNSQALHMQADRSQITQLLRNLVANAVNYTQPGGRVSVSVNKEGIHSARIQVQDTGIGIIDSEKDRLFERFYRGNHTRDGDIPGTGLGLSIVKAVVDQHQGTISVESQEGVGSTFTVLLPLTQRQHAVSAKGPRTGELRTVAIE